MFVFGSGFVLLKINQRAPITAISKLTNKKPRESLGLMLTTLYWTTAKWLIKELLTYRI